MKIITLSAIYLITSLLSLAEGRLHSIYNEESRALVSFLKTEKENQIECIRICILNESNQSKLEIYAQSAIHSDNKWVLNSGRYISYDTEKNEPIRMQEFENKTLEELSLSLEALYQKNEEFIIYLPKIQIFRASPEKSEGIYFVKYEEGEFLFLSADKYTVSEKDDPILCILTLVDGKAATNPFKYSSQRLQLLQFDSISINLPFEALRLLKPNQS